MKFLTFPLNLGNDEKFTVPKIANGSPKQKKLIEKPDKIKKNKKKKAQRAEPEEAEEMEVEQQSDSESEEESQCEFLILTNNDSHAQEPLHFSAR